MTATATAHQEFLEVRSPASGVTIEHVGITADRDIPAFVTRAREAQPGWERLGVAGRARIFKRAQTWLRANQQRVVETIVAENGKTYEDALLPEFFYGVHSLGFWAANAAKYLSDDRVRFSRSPLVFGKELRVAHHPHGVVAVIGPWNYPLLNNFGDAVPALLAGNSVVLKPASATPLTSLLMAEMLSECGVPDDVFQVLIAPGSAMATLIDAVDMVMFTGSTENGRKVLERAAKTLTPVSLELGGNDPMLVLDDANIERAARCAAQYGLSNAGQVCIGTERVYVDRSIYEQFVIRLGEITRALRVGAPGTPGSVDIGAITTEGQLATVEEHVADALAKGARLVSGGHRVGGRGYFHEPTVLADCTSDMLVMQEETFGPVLAIAPVSGEDEAVRSANDSPYGLTASVFTKNLDRGRAVARRLAAGAVMVNDSQIHYLALELPMSGWKNSGLGTRHGIDGIRKYTQPQTIVVTRFGPAKEPHMFPYRKLKTNQLSRVIGILGRGFGR
jgi:acyl-CoA reductase-like NAD-dependent aldehyde dehydrogenase